MENWTGLGEGEIGGNWCVRDNMMSRSKRCNRGCAVMPNAVILMRNFESGLGGGKYQQRVLGCAWFQGHHEMD